MMEAGENGAITSQVKVCPWCPTFNVIPVLSVPPQLFRAHFSAYDFTAFSGFTFASFGDPTFSVASARDLPDYPHLPTGTVRPKAKTNSPKDTSRSTRWPDGPLGRIKEAAATPSAPGRIMGEQQIAGGT